MQVHWLAAQPDYTAVWEAMQAYTDARTPTSPDQIWLVEHAPVYTLGQAGKDEHILNPKHIPVVRCDRGGQVTYHGPGQLTAYCLVDLRRLGIYVREYVHRLETAIIATLAECNIAAWRKAQAPGVYVQGQSIVNAPYAADELVKIAALGVKIRHGRSYHGLSLNVHMDLSPFDGINPCGYAQLGTTDMYACGYRLGLPHVAHLLTAQLQQQFSPTSEHAYE